MKTSNEIRKAFLDFWQESPRNSKVIPNASLVPLNDPTLLFVNSGMFPIVPYLSGQPHPLGKRVHNVQKCVRTNDIEEVGDNRHMIMFEMIGNWSLGDFNKVDQIPWIFEFYVEKLKMDPRRIYVSVFGGDESAGRDDLAINTWIKTFAKYGVEAEFSENVQDIPETLEQGLTWKKRIFPFNKKKNWWTRAELPGEIGGPCSEMFYDMGVKEKEDPDNNINDDSGRFVEIGNNVFMEFKFSDDRKWVPLEQKNIDFGGGFERIVMAAQEKMDPYVTDLFDSVIKKVEELSGKKYESKVEIKKDDTWSFRIVAEHARSSTFILADAVIPGGKDQGYILRRIIRRMIRHGLKLGIENNFTKQLAQIIIETYSESYPHLKENESKILEEIEKEEVKFRRTLNAGLRELEKLSVIDGKKAFYIYETYGFPVEMILEELQNNKTKYKLLINDSDSNVKFINNEILKKMKFEELDRDKTWRESPEYNLEEVNKSLTEEFNKAQDEHKSQSRSGAEQKFKGGLADASVETTKLHTAHHLLLAALQKLVDPNIKQRGSNITAERLRIDFNLDRKLTDEEIKKVEDLVNEKINENLDVIRIEIPKEDAEKIGAQMEFGQKYPDMVSVYLITDNQAANEIVNSENKPLEISNSKLKISSMEFCGGPHVSNTKEIGEGGKKFKIAKQENVGAGIKRIKASLV